MFLPTLLLTAAACGTATPTPSPTCPDRPASPLGERRLDLDRALDPSEIDNSLLERLAADGRVEQPEARATPQPDAGSEAIWQELAARAEAAAADRDAWRSRLLAALRDAELAAEAVTLAEAEVGAAWIAYLREKKEVRRELVLAPRLEVAKGRLAAARQRTARAREEVERIRRDARRAGVPPGWLRGLAG